MSLACSETGEILEYPYPFFVLSFKHEGGDRIFSISKEIIDQIPQEDRKNERVTNWLEQLEVCEGISKQNSFMFNDAWTWSDLSEGEFRFSISFDNLGKVAPSVTGRILSHRPTLQ